MLFYKRKDKNNLWMTQIQKLVKKKKEKEQNFTSAYLVYNQNCANFFLKREHKVFGWDSLFSLISYNVNTKKFKIYVMK